MKVVLFCGGQGMRIRDAENLPKPMVQIGYRPILWHVMKYYAHFGHKDFILCLGHRADAIKNYFLNYDECASNDFVLSGGGKNLELINSDIHDWRITFADTGSIQYRHAPESGGEIFAGEEEFLANYSDGLTDLPLPSRWSISTRQQDCQLSLRAAPTSATTSFRLQLESSSLVSSIHPIDNGTVRINGGFFVFKQAIFDYMREKEELVIEPFQRLLAESQLIGYAYDGFWASMDTFKDKQHLENLYSSGSAPWEVWKSNGKY